MKPSTVKTQAVKKLNKHSAVKNKNDQFGFVKLENDKQIKPGRFIDNC